MIGNPKLRDLAAIQYLGMAGTSKHCLEALCRLLALPDRPQRVLLLSAGSAHAFLVDSELDGMTAVKSGFRSGYRGEGPGALADALCAIETMQVAIQEVEVQPAVLERLDACALTHKDLQAILEAQPVRPIRHFDYIYAMSDGTDQSCNWHRFPLSMPWPMLDARLVDLALAFNSDPDKAIIDGFRRLEDVLRRRTGFDEHGAKLFSKAFAGDDAPLVWLVPPATEAELLRLNDVDDGPPHQAGNAQPQLIDKGEQSGRAQLFAGTFMAFRNPRAHRSPNDHPAQAFSEFLLLNQLFHFEAQAVARPKVSDAAEDAKPG